MSWRKNFLQKMKKALKKREREWRPVRLESTARAEPGVFFNTCAPRLRLEEKQVFVSLSPLEMSLCVCP